MCCLPVTVVEGLAVVGDSVAVCTTEIYLIPLGILPTELHLNLRHRFQMYEPRNETYLLQK